jgi:hypothetical protein
LALQLNSKSKNHAKLVGIESANLVKVVKVKVLDNIAISEFLLEFSLLRLLLVSGEQ